MKLSRLFKPCQHEYKYYHCESIPRNSFVHSFQHKFSFICTKCEKVTSVTEDELTAAYEEFQEVVNRARALGKQIELKPTSLTIKTHDRGLVQFNGAACTMLLKHYSDLNLMQCQPIKRSHCEGSMSYAEGECL